MPETLAYGHHRLVPTETTIAGYGARLLWDEVMAGFEGVVWDRQDAFGGKDLVERSIFPCVKQWIRDVREMKHAYLLQPSDDEPIRREYDMADGHVIVQGSPQGSYGYIYVTALLEPKEAS